MVQLFMRVTTSFFILLLTVFSIARDFNIKDFGAVPDEVCRLFEKTSFHHGFRIDDCAPPPATCTQEINRSYAAVS